VLRPGRVGRYLMLFAQRSVSWDGVPTLSCKLLEMSGTLFKI
jgi:hypothetical protein